LVGGLIFLTKLRISPDSAVSINWSVTIVFIVVIGGIGTIEGPIVGAVLFFLLREYLSEVRGVWIDVFSLLAIVGIVEMKGGIRGAVQSRCDLRFFRVQRRAAGRKQ